MTRVFIRVSLIALIAFSVAILVLHFVAPNLNPLEFGISFYALTDYRLLISLALALVGVSGLTLSFSMWPSTTSMVGRIGLLLLVAWSLFSILAGVFPLDAPGTAPTLSGRIHGLAGMNFLLVVPAVLLIELNCRKGKAASQSRSISFWLAWLVLVSAVLLFTFNGPLHALGIGGAFQRFYWLILVFWLLSKTFEAAASAERLLIQNDELTNAVSP
jgi:hypothetical protein